MAPRLLALAALAASAKALKFVFEEQEELWGELSFPPPEAQMYAFDLFQEGEIAEGRGKDGVWLPVFVLNRGFQNSWNIHVADAFPGYDLPNVPTNLIRKKLQEGQADFYVDNSVLKHQGLGVKYRHSKNIEDKQAEFAPWGSLVTGTDEGDGWIRTALGYLPVLVHGTKVLEKKDRLGSAPAMPEEFQKLIDAELERRRQDAEELEKAKIAKERQASVTFEIGEHVEMKTRHSGWFHARIRGPAAIPDAYDVVVQVDAYSVYPVKNVLASRIRKLGPAPHVPVAGESPMCQQQGCIEIHAKAESGEDMVLHVSKRMGTDMLMKMACNKLKIEWGDCLSRVTFTHKGERLASSIHIYEAGMEDMDEVEVSVAPTFPLEDA